MPDLTDKERIASLEEQVKMLTEQIVILSARALLAAPDQPSVSPLMPRVVYRPGHSMITPTEASMQSICSGQIFQN